jgi:hypothetical protein
VVAPSPAGDDPDRHAEVHKVPLGPRLAPGTLGRRREAAPVRRPHGQAAQVEQVQACHQGEGGQMERGRLPGDRALM